MHHHDGGVLAPGLVSERMRLVTPLGFLDTCRAPCRNWQDRAAPACAYRARPPPSAAISASSRRRKFSAWFLRHSSTSNSGLTAAVARSAATSADDSVKPAGLAEHHLVGADLGVDIVGVRMDHDAVDRFQQRQFDEILPLDEAAGRRRRRDHQQRVAGVGIDQPVQQAGIGQRHGDIGERGIGDVAHTISGSGAACTRSAKVSVQFVPLERSSPVKRRHLRAVETDADRLALFQRQPADIADRSAPPLAADRLDIDRLGGIEHQPHGIGAAEQRRRRRRGKGKRHAQAVAVAPRVDGSRGRFRSARLPLPVRRQRRRLLRAFASAGASCAGERPSGVSVAAASSRARAEAPFCGVSCAIVSGAGAVFSAAGGASPQRLPRARRGRACSAAGAACSAVGTWAPGRA